MPTNKARSRHQTADESAASAPGRARQTTLSAFAARRTQSAVSRIGLFRSSAERAIDAARRNTIRPRAGVVEWGTTNKRAWAVRPTASTKRCLRSFQPSMDIDPEESGLSTGAPAFADQFSAMSTISPRTGRRASTRAGSSRARSPECGHQAPSISSPGDGLTVTRTGLANLRALLLNVTPSPRSRQGHRTGEVRSWGVPHAGSRADPGRISIGRQPLTRVGTQATVHRVDVPMAVLRDFPTAPRA